MSIDPCECTGVKTSKSLKALYASLERRRSEDFEGEKSRRKNNLLYLESVFIVVDK
jgi:hypothetical protein